MKNIIKILKIDVLIFLALFFVILLWFRNGFFIFHDFSFSLILERYVDIPYLWTKYFNLGEFGFSGPGSLFLNLLLWGVVSLKNLLIAETVLFLVVFIFLYFLSLKFFFLISNSKVISHLANLFYFFNLYSLCRLYDGHFFLVIIYLFLPFVVYLFFRYLVEKKNILYLFSLGIVLFAIGSGFGNYPMAAGMIYIPLILFLVVYLLRSDSKKEVAKRVFVFCGVCFLVNIYWILPVAYYYFGSYAKSYIAINQQYGFDWADIQGQKGGIFSLLKFNSHWLWNAHWAGGDWYYFSDAYDKNVVFAFLTPVFSLFGLGAAFFVKNKKRNLFFMYAMILLVVHIFLANGIQDPFGNFWKFLYSNLPLFNIFRAPPTKFGGPIVFSVAILLVYLLVYLKNKSKRIYGASVIFLVIGIFIVAYPLISGGVFFGEKRGYWDSRNISHFPKAYLDISKKLNNYKIDANIYEYPFSLFGFFDLGYKNHEGVDILKYIVNKGVVSICSGFSEDCNIITLFQSNLNDKIKALSVINGRYILNRLDTIDYENSSVKKGYDLSGDDLGLVEDGGNIKLFRVRDEYFLPHLYVPQKSLISQRTINDLPKIISSPDWQIRSAVFFQEQNEGKEDVLDKLKINNHGSSEFGNDSNASTLDSRLRGNDNSLPTFEFKKINPTKYRVRVHGASGVFPVVFSESFHNGWKAYLVKPSQEARSKKQEVSLNSYKILDGNSEDQATEDELRKFIKKGLVTDLGDGKEKTIEHKKWDGLKEKLDYVEKYNIDFISKNFQGTIQNDNLPKGSIFETWLRKPIENNANHLMANGYANSWVIDTVSLCAPSSPASSATPFSPQPSPRAGEGEHKCIKNADGSYDFELVVEFWPQRLFYIGLFVSGTTLLLCLGYLGYDWNRRRGALRNVIESKDAKILRKN